MSELSPTQAGNAGPVDELSKRRMEAIAKRAEWRIKPIEKRRTWSDKREE